MRNVALLISLLALLMITAGCQGGGGTSGISTGSAFIGGSQAIKMSFVENAPPSEVTDNPKGEPPFTPLQAKGAGFQFNTIVTIENIGEQSIPAGMLDVSLIGFDPGDFGTTKTALKVDFPDELNGVRKDPDGNRIQGDLAQIDTFPVLEYQKKLRGTQAFPIWAEACYPYRTEAISQICILDDLTKPDRSLCDPTGSKSISNSGGPVHVTSVTQGVGGKNKVLLTFNVRKVGSSDIFKLSTDKCSDKFTNKDRVTVTVDTGSDLTPTLKCLGLLGGGTDDVTGDLLLTDGSASFTCIQTLSDESIDSVKSYTVELDYYAKDVIKTSVVVKSLLTE